MSKDQQLSGIKNTSDNKIQVTGRPTTILDYLFQKLVLPSYIYVYVYVFFILIGKDAIYTTHHHTCHDDDRMSVCVIHFSGMSKRQKKHTHTCRAQNTAYHGRKKRETCRVKLKVNHVAAGRVCVDFVRTATFSRM